MGLEQMSRMFSNTSLDCGGFKHYTGSVMTMTFCVCTEQWCVGRRNYVLLMMRVTSIPNFPFAVTKVMHPLKKYLSYLEMPWEEFGLEMRWTSCWLEIQFCLSLLLKHFKLETQFPHSKNKSNDCYDKGRSLWCSMPMMQALGQLITVMLLEYFEYSKHSVDDNCHCHHQQIICHNCHQKLITGQRHILVDLVFKTTSEQTSTQLKWQHEPHSSLLLWITTHTLVKGNSTWKYRSDLVCWWECNPDPFPSDIYNVAKRFPRLCTQERILRLHLEQAETLFEKWSFA